jgi:hypothetical protein
MTWKNAPESIVNYVGFVYVIIERRTNMRYYGIKKFWRTVKSKALSSRTKNSMTKKEKDRLELLQYELMKAKELRTSRSKCKEELKIESKIATLKRNWKKRVDSNSGKQKRSKLVETDWKTYNTSSQIMQKKLTDNPEKYNKFIMKLCESVTEMKAYEAYYQLEHYVNGEWDDVYNEMINLRLRIPKCKQNTKN